jgi:hypothetical protein
MSILATIKTIGELLCGLAQLITLVILAWFAWLNHKGKLGELLCGLALLITLVILAWFAWLNHKGKLIGNDPDSSMESNRKP